MLTTLNDLYRRHIYFQLRLMDRMPGLRAYSRFLRRRYDQHFWLTSAVLTTASLVQYWAIRRWSDKLIDSLVNRYDRDLGQRNNNTVRYFAQAFDNTNPMAMMRGYLLGDLLVQQYAATFVIEPTGDLTNDHQFICERMFGILNADDRPTAQTNKSLSIGDVVSVFSATDGRFYYYACAALGWQLLDQEPPNMDLDLTMPLVAH